MKIVLLGAPGSGKGTHSEYLQKKLKVPHISTGEIFRDAMSKKTELGILAASYIDYGNLVPDDVTIELVKERLKQPDCINGYLLDGFPRTVNQAEIFLTFQKVDLALYFNIDLEVALNRLLNRRMCKDCGAIYNLLTYNKTHCELCGGELVTRDDDNEQVIRKRFEVYKEKTYPLVPFFKEKNLVREIDSNKTIIEIENDIKEILGDFNV